MSFASFFSRTVDFSGWHEMDKKMLQTFQMMLYGVLWKKIIQLDILLQCAPENTVFYKYVQYQAIISADKFRNAF